MSSTATFVDTDTRYARYSNRPEIVRQDESATRNVYRCPQCGRWSWATITDWTVDVFHVRKHEDAFDLTTVSRYAWDVYGEAHLLRACCPENFSGVERNGQDGDPSFIDGTQRRAETQMQMDLRLRERGIAP